MQNGLSPIVLAAAAALAAACSRDVATGRRCQPGASPCSAPASAVAWTIHNVGVGTWFLVDGAGLQLGTLPGVAGLGVPAFEECVAASRQSAALELDFAGGKLGVWLFDYPYDDNVPGEGGRNPSWCLTRL